MDWADGPKGKASVKLHMVWEPGASVPLAARVTGPRVNDITPAKAARIVPGGTYVFDLGYYSFDWWSELHARSCRFVTRLKRHTHLQDIEERPVPEGSAILAERTGRIATRSAAGLPMRLREIEVRIATGKVIRVVTNDLDSPAEEIAGLYRTRWQIELAFKWIKQNLKLRRFLGTSENAVRIQIFTALIAFLLIRMAHAAQSQVTRPTTFARLVTCNLMHRRPLNSLANPPPPAGLDPRKQAFKMK